MPATYMKQKKLYDDGSEDDDSDCQSSKSNIDIIGYDNKYKKIEGHDYGYVGNKEKIMMEMEKKKQMPAPQ